MQLNKPAALQTTCEQDICFEAPTQIWAAVSGVPNVLRCEWREISFRVDYLLGRIKPNTDGVYILNKQSRLSSDDDSEEVLSSGPTAVKMTIFSFVTSWESCFSLLKVSPSSSLVTSEPGCRYEAVNDVFEALIESYVTLRSPLKDEGCWVSDPVFGPSTRRKRGPIHCGSSWIN